MNSTKTKGARPATATRPDNELEKSLPGSTTSVKNFLTPEEIRGSWHDDSIPAPILAAKLTPMAKLVYGKLVGYWNKTTGTAWPGHERLARQLGTCRTNIVRAVEELENYTRRNEKTAERLGCSVADLNGTRRKNREKWPFIRVYARKTLSGRRTSNEYELLPLPSRLAKIGRREEACHHDDGDCHCNDTNEEGRHRVGGVESAPPASAVPEALPVIESENAETAADGGKIGKDGYPVAFDEVQTDGEALKLEEIEALRRKCEEGRQTLFEAEKVIERELAGVAA